jgi:hypothetical protein
MKTSRCSIFRSRLLIAGMALMVTVLLGPLLASETATEHTIPQLTLGTNQLNNVVIIQASPVDLLLKHERGYLRVNLQDLPDPLKEKYPYDAEKAAAYRKSISDTQRLKAMLAHERDLQSRINEVELQQERVRQTMRNYRGRPGKPDAGKMKNLDFEIKQFEKQKHLLRVQLNRAVEARLAMQGQIYTPPSPSAPLSPPPGKKKRKS